MNVHQLNLANFRGFQQIELNFKPDVNVIAGINGAGKSAVLYALAALFSRALPEFTPSTARPLQFSDDDIYHEKSNLEVSAIFSVAGKRCHMGTQRVRGDDKGDRFDSFWRNATGEATAERPIDFAQLLAERTLAGNVESGAEMNRDVRALAQRETQPLVIYFSPRRQLPGKPKTLPKPAPFEQKNAYLFALEDRDVTLREFMHWFRSREYLFEKQGAERDKILNAMRAVVTSFIDEFHGLRIEEKPSLKFVVDKSGVPLALNQLSDGERGLLAIIFDITRRLAIANPTLDDPIANGEAIVLIDEIDLHLHPAWQRQVIPRLLGTFKNCQFIVTTHSPQVLGETKPASVLLLSKSEATNPAQSFGMDSNWILETLMGGDQQDPMIKDKIDALFGFIDTNELDRAATELQKVRAETGNSDRLQFAASLIERLRLLGK